MQQDREAIDAMTVSQLSEQVQKRLKSIMANTDKIRKENDTSMT